LRQQSQALFHIASFFFLSGNCPHALTIQAHQMSLPKSISQKSALAGRRSGAWSALVFSRKVHPDQSRYGALVEMAMHCAFDLRMQTGKAIRLGEYVGTHGASGKASLRRLF
jgi:hypothetical protein